MADYTQEDLADHHAVAGLIKNSKKDILMQNHVKYGFWTIPIGKAKPHQSPAEGFKKEMSEECNINITGCKEIAAKEYGYIRNNKKVKVILHLFEVIKYSGKIMNNEPKKHKEQKFISLKKIKKIPYLSDSTLLYLETLGFKRKAKIT